jgi:hypothetical protein
MGTDKPENYGCGGLDMLGEGGFASGWSSLVMCTLAWVSGTVPSFTCTSIGLPWMRTR